MKWPYQIMIVWKRQKSGTSSDIEWQRVTTNENKWYNEWQRVTKSDIEWYNECQRVIQRVTTSGAARDNEWQRVTKNDNQWQQRTASDKTNQCEWK